MKTQWFNVTHYATPDGVHLYFCIIPRGYAADAAPPRANLYRPTGLWITAETAVVIKNGSPRGCGIATLLPKQQFHRRTEPVSRGASRISLCPNEQDFTFVSQDASSAWYLHHIFGEKTCKNALFFIKKMCTQNLFFHWEMWNKATFHIDNKRNRW